MTLDSLGSLPQESDSQRIGRLASKCFLANCPNTWAPDPTDGDDDYGFDYQIQVIIRGSVTDIFRLQLKGSTVPSLSADGEFFSVTLEASTVRYYARVTDPIMLVLCDLSVDESRPKNCPLYFVWIHEELRRINQRHVPADQQSINLRVPSKNLLDDDLDISAYLEHIRDIQRSSDAMDSVVQEKYPTLLPNERANLISRLPDSFRTRSPVLLEVMGKIDWTPWPEAPAGSLPWYLKKAASLLQEGSAEEAEDLLLKVKTHLSGATPIETSEFWFLRGRLHAFRLEHNEARDAYLNATKTSENQPKYLTAWAQAEMQLSYQFDESNDFSYIITKLSGSDPLSLELKARLIAAEGRYQDALKITETISGLEHWSAKAIIHTMQGEPKLAMEACKSGLTEPELSRSKKQLFLILRARARFHLAVGKINSNGPGARLPVPGPAGTDPAMLHDAWSDIVAAVESLRASGWPANVEFIADIWAGVALMLDLQKDILPLLKEAAEARPTLHTLQSALESIAIRCCEWDIALDANARRPESNTRTLERIILLHRATYDQDCVKLLTSVEHALPSSHPLFGVALSFAILSANRIVKPEVAQRWKTILESDPSLAPQRALYDFYWEVSQDLLAKDVALLRLEERYQELGCPIDIAINLFHEFDATNLEQAEQCIALAAHLQSKYMLSSECVIQLAQAFVTLSRWQDLFDLARESLLRFDRNGRFIALKALALDKLGNSTEALSTLKELIEKGKSDPFALKTYINIVWRCGFVSEAIESVERILSSEAVKNKQIEYLRLLFALLNISEPASQRCVDVAWRIGQLVDREDEVQEGFFLTTMLAATLPANIAIDKTKRLEFQHRIEVFSQQFPASKILKQATIPEDISPEDLLWRIRQLIGIDDEQLRHRNKFKEGLSRGSISIPYAWRPRHFLDNVYNLPMLWEFGKQAKPDQRQFHLTMTLSEKRVSLAAMQDHVPLLDLTSLLVIHDLQLWGHLFRLFRKIAIGQATLIELQQLVGPMSGNPFLHKCLELQSALKERFEQIIQPFADPPKSKDDPLIAQWASEEVKLLANEGRFMLYSDDVSFRLYCEAPSGSPPSICTLDVLSALDETGMLPVVETAQKIATLCKWNVGLVVSGRHQIAILPDSLVSAKSVSNGIEVLRESPLCYAMFSALWSPAKPYEKLQGHASALLRELCNEERNPLKSITSLIGLWASKARLHRSAPQPVSKVIVHLIMQAVSDNSSLSVECTRRLWNVFRELVALEHGIRMNEAKEREAFMLAGQITAEIDHKTRLQGRKSMKERLKTGLIEGTSDSDAFNEGYTQKYTQYTLEQLRKG